MAVYIGTKFGGASQADFREENVGRIDPLLNLLNLKKSNRFRFRGLVDMIFRS